MSGGDVLGGEDVLSGGVVFYSLCFISRVGWPDHLMWRIILGLWSHFGCRRPFRVAESSWVTESLWVAETF